MYIFKFYIWVRQKRFEHLKQIPQFSVIVIESTMKFQSPNNESLKELLQFNFTPSQCKKVSENHRCKLNSASSIFYCLIEWGRIIWSYKRNITVFVTVKYESYSLDIKTVAKRTLITWFYHKLSDKSLWNNRNKYNRVRTSILPHVVVYFIAS
jgi:hypothetical protein